MSMAFSKHADDDLAHQDDIDLLCDIIIIIITARVAIYPY